MGFLADTSNSWTLIVSSNNPGWIHRCTRVITMGAGQIINETIPKTA